MRITVARRGGMIATVTSKNGRTKLHQPSAGMAARETTAQIGC
jgi:hypothetical protein